MIELDGTGRVGDVVTLADGRDQVSVSAKVVEALALVHDRAVLRDPDLARTVTAAVKLAIENQWMHSEIQARASEARTLPTGFVTFLFSDIEDSTGLVRHLGDRYERFLGEVRRLLRASIAAATSSRS